MGWTTHSLTNRSAKNSVPMEIVCSTSIGARVAVSLGYYRWLLRVVRWSLCTKLSRSSGTLQRLAADKGGIRVVRLLWNPSRASFTRLQRLYCVPRETAYMTYVLDIVLLHESCGKRAKQLVECCYFVGRSGPPSSTSPTSLGGSVLISAERAPAED